MRHLAYSSLVVLSVILGAASDRTLAITPPITQSAAVTSPLTQGYLLGAGDRLRVDIFNVPEYSGEYSVLSDGTLNLPVVGSTSVQGLTIQQATTAVSNQFASILRRPIVTLSIVSTRPINVAIAGEIHRPGSYTLASDGSEVPSLTNALRLAGGVTQSADLGVVEIRRRQPNGGDQRLRVNLWELVQSGNLQQDVMLQDGDRIVIPTADQLSLTEARQLATTSFASPAEPIAIAVIGQVNRPGPYTLSPTSGSTSATVPTITQAIQQAGGITQLADIRGIQIRRLAQSGEEQRIDVDLWSLLKDGNLQQDLPLQAGDTVIVPTATALTASELTELASASFAPDSITINVVGEVARPGSIVLTPNSSLTQAILAAGGFNNRARRSEVELIRLNPDGTISQQTIEVDFSAGVTTASNPALRPNDTIIVGRSGLAGFSDVLGTVLSPITGVFGLFRLLGL